MPRQVQVQETRQEARLRAVSSAPQLRAEPLRERARQLRRPVIRAD
jgi:hypothetical protein